MCRRLVPCLVASFFLTGNAVRAQTTSEAEPSFSRHVIPLLSKLGCNGGACHGAVQGQNGFKLSLFGANPALDHERLLREAGGRRVNLNQPDQSLLLRKGAGLVSHEGGQRFKVDGPEHAIFKRWLEAGARLDNLEASRLVKLRVTPAQQTSRPGESHRLKAEASFADGSTDDVTDRCAFESLDKQVASVDQHGQVKILSSGDATILVRFIAEPAISQVLVPRVGQEEFPKVAANNFIDEHILAKLRRLNIPPVELADDVTFLRRVSLDVAGELPTPEEIRAFLADTKADKRARKIEELLNRPGYTALWTLKFGDLLKASDFGVYADGLTQEHDAPRFAAWMRARLEENVPYDQLVERILTATSREGRPLAEWAKEVQAVSEGYVTPRLDLKLYSQRKTLDLYWQRKAANGVTGALQIAHTFLGLRLECAQCHRHPHDVWQQDDLLSFANFFMHVRQPGFQGDNDKKFPETAAFVKTLSAEEKKLNEDVKKMRETEGKELDAQAKKTKSKEDQEALKKFQDEVGRLDRRAKMLPTIGQRILHAEVAHVAPVKGTVASVTSPLGTQESKQYRLLGDAKSLEVGKDQDPRALVVAWMRRPDNPFFAKAIVNRVWAHYFGRGIVDPPDHLSPLNPPSHPELLDDLCRQFIKNNYDLKWLHRTILASRTYQQSSQATAANATDRSNYSRFYLRRLPAEVLLDALSQATGTAEDFDMKYYHWPADWRTLDIPYPPRNAFVTFMLEQFGKPARNSASQCDCERDSSASVLQVLSFANHPRVRQRLADDKGTVARLLKNQPDEGKRLDEIFLRVLCRLPSAAEREACMAYVEQAASPVEGWRGVMWSLLNTREFMLQH